MRYDRIAPEDKTVSSNDPAYLKLLLSPVRLCAGYKPKFGQGRDGLTLAQFQQLYQSDPFYGWFGLDSPMLYAAHRTAGGMTSVYRQIGIGCERLFRAVLVDSLELSQEDVVWSYKTPLGGGKTRTLHLDGRVPLSKIANKNTRGRMRAWMRNSAKAVDADPKVCSAGAVFEVRQGYKSKDSKRQNADIANAAAAYSHAYLPCVLLFSGQIDGDVLARYRATKWSVLTGAEENGDSLTSTYGFMREVIGYDLAAFFKRNRKALRTEINTVLKTLLTRAK